MILKVFSNLKDVIIPHWEFACIVVEIRCYFNHHGKFEWITLWRQYQPLTIQIQWTPDPAGVEAGEVFLLYLMGIGLSLRRVHFRLNFSAFAAILLNLQSWY